MDLLSLDIVEKVRKLWLCGESKKVFLGSIDEGADGAYRYLQDITDFFVAFVFHKGEHDNSFIFFWQSSDDRLYCLVSFVCCDGA